MAADDFASGILAGQEYQLNKFKILAAPAAVEDGQVKVEQDKLALKIGQQDYTNRQKMAELLAKNSHNIPEGQNPLTNAAASLLTVGSAEIESGMVEEGAATLAKASTITHQQEDAAYKNWQMVIQKTKFSDQMLATATDQKSWDAMNAMIYMTTGQKSQFADHKYSPELVEQLKQAGASKRTQAQEALTKAQTERTKLGVAADNELIKLRKTQESLNAARETNLKKVGGDGLIAKPKNIAAVTDALVKDSGDSLSPGDARVFARDIALDVEKRMDKDHQTQAQAVASSIDYAKKHGVLAGLTPAHSRPGQSQKKPLPLPQEAAGYKDQQWYQAPDGPRWYDAETQMLYKQGEGPPDDESEDEE